MQPCQSFMSEFYALKKVSVVVATIQRRNMYTDGIRKTKTFVCLD